MNRPIIIAVATTPFWPMGRGVAGGALALVDDHANPRALAKEEKIFHIILDDTIGLIRFTV
jgi:hypothetical protein